MPRAVEAPERACFFSVPVSVQAAAVVFLTGLLYFRIFFIPLESPAAPDFESGWQGAMEYAAFYGLPFGRQIFYHFGPLGYLASAAGLGLLGPACILFAVFWTLLVCVCVLDFQRVASPGVSLLLGGWVFVFHHPHNVFDYEFQPMMVILTLAHAVFFAPGQRVRMLALAVVLALFSVMKASFLPLSAVMLVLFFGVCWKEKRFAEGCLFGFFYAAFVLAIWILAGQPLDGLFPWIRAVLLVIRGYAESQAIAGDPGVLRLGMAGVLFFYIFAAASIWRLRRSAGAVAFILFSAVLVLIQWRHAFARADTHLFFLTRLLPGAFLIFTAREIWPAVHRRWYGLWVAGGLTAVTVFSLLANDRLTDNVRHQAHRSLEPIAASFARFEKLFTYGMNFPASGKSGCGVNPDCQLDKVREFSGTRSVDAYNNDQAALLLNGLHYSPRPLIHGFGAITPELQQLDLDWYRRAPPDLVLFRMATLDRHFPSSNDAPMLLFLLHNARPVLAEKRFLLFDFFEKKREMPSGRSLWRGRVPYGQIVSLEKWNHEPLMLRMRMKRTFWGRVMLDFFRAGSTHLHVQSGKSAFIPYTLIGGMAEEGFLINPLLLSNQQVLSLATPDDWRRARSFLITHDRSFFREYEKEYELEVIAMPQLVESARWKAARDVLPERMLAGLETYQGPAPLKIVFAADFAGALAPPSSRLVLKIPEGSLRVQGQFAMMETSYDDGARTHGVRFIAEVEDLSGRLRPALDRVLDPFAHPAERVPGTYRIELQPGDRRLVLRTEPGPEGLSQWDQSVWMPPEFSRERTLRAYPAYGPKAEGAV